MPLFKSITKRRHPFQHWSIARLRLVLGISLLLLVIPTVVLSLKARQQIKWEALYQQRQLAEELSQRIDSNLQRWLIKEQQRPAAEYNYLLDQNQLGATNYLQRSPLSQWPSTEAPPGLLGYFQVNSDGQLSSPLLPDSEKEGLSSGLSVDEIRQRQEIKQGIEAVLSENQLVSPKPEDAFVMEDDAYGAEAQASFDKLSQNREESRQLKNLGKISELDLERSFADAEPMQQAKRAIKEEQKSAAGAYPAKAKPQLSILPSASAPASVAPETVAPELMEAIPAPVPIKLFNHNTSAFNLSLLDSGHLILFRNAWVNNQRLVQGMLIEQNQFIQSSIQQAFDQSSLSDNTNLVIAYQGTVLKILSSNQYRRMSLNYASLSAQDVKGTLLLQNTLSNPLAELELIFSATRLPDGPGGTVITWASILLLMLLFVIFGLLHRFGVRQIRLLQQQQNFIASVSHELKTPLTSIRMFSEMLKEGWTPPEKQQEYFTFISDESERLSRLITNVLQLARMERQELRLNTKPMTVNQLVDLLRSRLESQVAQTEFSLNVQFDAINEAAKVSVDADAMMQVMMNLVDNSLKFSKDASNKTIDFHIYQQQQSILFELRDYGPGIPPQEQPRVFDLFYRVGNELTRSAQGTGIGLALVQQLISEMGGSIRYFQPELGAGFRIQLPVTSEPL